RRTSDMAYDFPNSPVNGQIYTPAGGPTYVYNAPSWVAQTVVGSSTNDVGRNLIHNPLFNIAQRGAGPFTGGGYTLDRYLTSVVGSTFSVSAIALADADRAQIGA